MAVTARCFLGGQGFSAHFADFVPQEKKYVAVIAACPSIHGKLSRSNEEANSLSKEDVIEIEGIVREAMPNAIFKVEMLSEDKNTGKLTPSGHILLAHISGKLRPMESILSALIAGAVTLIGVLIANSRSQAVTDTKLEELTREVREHNNFARRVPILEEQMKVANHRIADLENHERMKERN